MVLSSSILEQLPSDWIVAPFEEYVFFQEGPGIRNWQYSNEGVPFVNIRCLVEGRLDISSMNKVTSEEAFGKYKHFLLDADDYVVSSSGTIGRIAQVREADLPVILNTSVIRMRPLNDHLNRVYLKQFLMSRLYQGQIEAMATGSAQLNYGPMHLRKMFIVVPPLEDQQRIAHILGTLDDKIELNREMAKTLEEIARAIFKSWFVDFDPVHAKANAIAQGKDPERAAMAAISGRNVDELDSLPPETIGKLKETAALFPDSFQDSELGDIPEGWEIGKLGDISRNIRHSVAAGDIVPDEPYVGLEHISKKSLCLTEWGRGNQVGSQKSRFHEGDVLFGKLRPYFHKVCIAPTNGICSTDILVINAIDSQWWEFVALTCSAETTIDFTTASSGGTRMPRTSWGDLERMPLTLPPSRVVRVFAEAVKPHLLSLQRITFESQTLAAIRDALLPKLLAGDMDISDLPTECEHGAN